MSTISLRRPWAWPAWLELRIDVDRPCPDGDPELAAVERRLRAPGGPRLRSLPIDAGIPRLGFHHREADGEHYVYVEDRVRGRLVGFTVFNRLVELDRRADRHLRAPHSRYEAAWQRRGLARAVYRWALGTGMCLITGPRQSTGAHALWQSLGREHPLWRVELRDRTLRCLSPGLDEPPPADLHARLLLLGRGWSMHALAAHCGIVAPTP